MRRVRDAKDRRRVTVAVREPALQLAVEFFRPLGARINEALDGVPTAELRAASAIVNRLTRAVTDARRAVG